jgi:hypothetical protein
VSPLRSGIAAGVVLGATVLGLKPAAAGGSTWDITPDPAVPGDVIHAEAVVAWAHNDGLGAPDDGPWRAWIRPLTGPDETHGGAGFVPDDAISVGDITVSDEGGRGTATVDFTLPELPAGDYELLHCNDPCTTTLGDITWGVFTVTAPASAQPPPPIEPAPTSRPAATVTTTSAPAAHLAVARTNGAGEEGPTVGLEHAGIIGGLITVLLFTAFHFLLPRNKRRA